MIDCIELEALKHIPLANQHAGHAEQAKMWLKITGTPPETFDLSLLSS